MLLFRMPVAMVAYRHDYVGLDDGRHGHGFDALEKRGEESMEDKQNIEAVE